ncbi:MAG TPA: GNAT family N-acetyltransferase, partial [Planctomycetota bacterium]|nr:GNAT family N-acetyltransferase [Planctomycetota bacterium]
MQPIGAPLPCAPMTVVVRTLRRDEIDQAADLTARVFGKPDEVVALRALMHAAYESCPFMPPELCFVALDGGRVVAKWQVLDFQMWMAGVPVRMAGIQGVVAEPDANHKGYARLIAEHALVRVREMGFDLVLGFAQRGGFYTRLGGVPLCADYSLELDANTVAPLRDDPFRPATDADLPALIRFYNESNRGRSGPLIRSEALWPWLVRRPQRIELCDAGYVGLAVFEDRIEIREVAGVGADFHDAAVRKLGAIARASGLRRITGAVPA